MGTAIHRRVEACRAATDPTAIARLPSGWAVLIRPALRALHRARIAPDGPFPADTLFAAGRSGDYDAVLCMYHDQALIPLKLLEFGRAVNISMRLPFIGTSHDHGTAYDLAGSGTARPDSMIEALLLAASMVRNHEKREHR